MSTLREPDCRSQFFKLSEENQEKIIVRLREIGAKEMVKELQAVGVTTSISSLHRFRHRWNLGHALQEAEAENDADMERLVLEHPEMTEEELTAIGNRKFNVRALKIKNNKEWVATQRLRIADANLALNNRRVALLEKQAARDQPPPKPVLSLEEQERRMKAIFGIVP